MAGASTIPDLTLAAAEHFADQPAVIDGSTRLSYGDLAGAARRFGAALVASGVEPGDRVSIWAYNSAEWIVAALGAWQAAAVVVPINTRFKGAEAADILRRSRARALVTVTGFLDTDYVELLRRSGVDLPDLQTIVVAQGEAPDGTQRWAAFLDRASSRLGAEVDRRRGRSARMIRRTSSLPPARPAGPKGSSPPTAAPASSPLTGRP